MTMSDQVKASVNAVIAIAEAIRELGEVPSGELYAVCCGHMDLTTFESFVSRLVRAGLVERRGDLLRWKEVSS